MTSENKPTDCTGDCNICGAGGILVCAVCGWDEYMEIMNEEL